MESRIAQAMNLEFNPVAIVLTDKKPDTALQFKPGKWGCVMFMFANAARGKTAVFDRETYGCWGGGVGLGFGNTYERFPGGVDCFTRFLSSGNKDWEKGCEVGKAMEEHAGKAFTEEFLEGERYVRNPGLVERWLDTLPITDVAATYVVFKPLATIDPGSERPETVVFLANADQLSALVILANYGRGSMDGVLIPWAAGCQTIGILPYREAGHEPPRAVVGLTDISARKYTRGLLGKDHLSFAMPWALFQEMETHVPGSFLERHTWQALRGPKAL